jgi:hypothetical protein
MGAMEAQQVPGLFTLQHEYEAWHRQDLYIHSRLMAAGASTDIDRVDDYQRFLDDFEAWRAHIQNYYETRLLTGYTDVDDLVELQARSQALIGTLAARAPSAAAQAKVAGAAAGSEAVARERAATAGLVDSYREEWEAVAQEGLSRWVELNAEKERWPEIAAAQERLARLADARADEARRRHKASKPDSDEAARLRAAAEEARAQALRRLFAGDGLTLDERVQWITSLAGDYRLRRIPWPEELWVAAARDLTQKSAQLRAQAAAAPDAAARAALSAAADQTDDMIRSNHAALLTYAAEDIPSIFAAGAPEHAAFQAVRAEAFDVEGRLIESLQAYEALAASIADDDAASVLRAKADAVRDRAVKRVADASGLTLAQRLSWINALAENLRGRDLPWPRGLWTASMRDYPARILELREQAAKEAEPEKSALEARARDFESVLEGNRAALRGFAESNLAAARAAVDAAERNNRVSWGSMQAEALGDADLIEAFKTLPPLAAAAPVPAQAP